MLTRDAATRAKWINLALDTLTPREQVIIRERQMQEDGVTLESLGERLGISKERVRQIEANALGKLKRALIEQVGDPVEAGLVAA
jgi:RNA polymerase sigma-32 factor